MSCAGRFGYNTQIVLMRALGLWISRGRGGI